MSIAGRPTRSGKPVLRSSRSIAGCLDSSTWSSAGLPGLDPFAIRTHVRYAVMANMRTLSTQVRLRRLIRSFDEAVNRLLSEPQERQVAASVVARLQELAAQAREGWRRENASNP